MEEKEYEVTEISDFAEAIINLETGEIIDYRIKKDIDIDGAVNWAAEKVAEYDLLTEKAKAHIEYLREQIKRYEKNSKSVKGWAARVTGGKKHDTGIHKVGRFRHWENMVDITSTSDIPVELKKERVSMEVDKAAVKDALMNGQEVPGARLTEYWSCSFDK